MFRRKHQAHVTGICPSPLCANTQNIPPGTHKMRELFTTFLDAMNSNLMPHFKYHLDSPLSRYFGCV